MHSLFLDRSYQEDLCIALKAHSEQYNKALAKARAIPLVSSSQHPRSVSVA